MQLKTSTLRHAFFLFLPVCFSACKDSEVVKVKNDVGKDTEQYIVSDASGAVLSANTVVEMVEGENKVFTIAVNHGKTIDLESFGTNSETVNLEPAQITLQAGIGSVRVSCINNDFVGNVTSEISFNKKDDASRIFKFQVRCLDNDSAQVRLELAAGTPMLLEGAANPTQVKATLTTKPKSAVRIALTGLDNRFQVQPAIAEISPANWNQPHTLSILYRNDDTKKSDQWISVKASSSSEDSDYDGLESAAQMIRAYDNDVAGYLATLTPVIQEGQANSLSIRLRSRPTAAVTFPVSLITTTPSPAPTPAPDSPRHQVRIHLSS